MTVLLLAVAGNARAAETVTVTLASGRSYTAAVDERSDEHRLWLRFERGRSTVWRPVDWASVVGAAVEGVPIPADQLRQRLDQLASARAQRRPPRREPAARAGGSPGEGAAAASVEAANVRSLYVDAWVANWDADVESDGVVVQVVALDELGRALAVDGTLEVNLLGDEYAAIGHGGEYGRLGRWARGVAAADFGPEGALYRLEFQAVHPEFETRISPFALVHARLTVPGSGMFDATTGMLSIRPYNGVRERLELEEGSRFFHLERTGRGRRSRSDSG